MTAKAHANLGEVVAAQDVITYGPGPRRVRSIILLLAGSVALMMTGLGIIIPVFARRFGELGGGVQALALMTMSFALAQFLAAPLMGSLADRYGRRPFVLLSLAAFAAANVGFLLASSVTAFTVVRALEGALTAGLYPAAMGIVADVAPEDGADDGLASSWPATAPALSWGRSSAGCSMTGKGLQRRLSLRR